MMNVCCNSEIICLRAEITVALGALLTVISRDTFNVMLFIVDCFWLCKYRTITVSSISVCVCVCVTLYSFRPATSYAFCFIHKHLPRSPRHVTKQPRALPAFLSPSDQSRCI